MLLVLLVLPLLASPRAPPLATMPVLATVPPTTLHPTAPTVSPTATPPEEAAPTMALHTAHMAHTALQTPLNAVPTSTPPPIGHPATATATTPHIVAATLQVLTVLHLSIALVAPSMITPTPPTVCPSPIPPEAALPATSTLVGVAIAPPRGVGCLEQHSSY